MSIHHSICCGLLLISWLIDCLQHIWCILSREKTLIIIKILKHFYCGVVIYNAMNYNETRVFHSYFTVILQTLQGAPVQYFHQACLSV